MNIIITGASQGLGLAIAETFAADKQGHNLMLCARNPDRLRAIMLNLQSRYPRTSIHYFALDITRRDQIAALAQNIAATFSSVDILINNAGSFLPGTITTEKEGTLEAMMEINLYGAVHLTKALLPAMLQAKKGHIFNIASTAALEAYPAGMSYSISKFALVGFSKNLREEMKPHSIKVTTVYPGNFYSESWEGSGIDPQRIMETNDVASTIYAAAHLSPQACLEDIVMRPQLGNV